MSRQVKRALASLISAKIRGGTATELLLGEVLCGRTAPAAFRPTANLIQQHKLELVGELREPEDDDEDGLNEVYQASGQLRRGGQPASLTRWCQIRDGLMLTARSTQRPDDINLNYSFHAVKSGVERSQ